MKINKYAMCAGVLSGSVAAIMILSLDWIKGLGVGVIAAIICFVALTVLELCREHNRWMKQHPGRPKDAEEPW